MKMRLLTAVLVLSCATPLFAAKARPRLPKAAQADGGAPFTRDQGKLRILQNGNQVGTEEFELAPSGNYWVARGNTVLDIPGSGQVRSTGLLRLTPDGAPIHYEWTAVGKRKASGTADFKNGTAKTSINLGGKEPLQEDFKFASPRIAVLDNNLYDQYAILGRLYDWNVGGKQTFPVLIPQDKTPGQITVDSLGTKTVDGRSLQVLSVRTSDIDVQVYFDAQHHLMRLEVPAADVVVVRQ